MTWMEWRKMAPGAERTAIRLVLAISAAFLLSLWSFVVFWGWHSRNELVENAGNDLQRLSSAVEEQTRRTFKVVEVFLVTAEYWLATHPQRDPRHDPEFAEMVAQFRQMTGEAIDVRLITADGGLFAVSSVAGGQLANVEQRDYFLAQRDQSLRGFYVGAPVRGRLVDRWLIPVSLPLRTAAPGRSGGVCVLLALVDAERLAAQFEAERPQPHGAIRLARHDGLLLAQAPLSTARIGSSLAGEAVFSRFLLAGSHGLVADGIGRPELLAYSALGDFPLVVLVAADEEDILATWRRQCWVVGVAGVLLTLLALAAATYLIGLQYKQARTHQELRRLATTDGLTGALNRRTFLLALEREALRARRYNNPLTVLMLDLDFFKRINDGYGHAAGDSALRAFAEAVRATLRTTDLFGRMGGEEFAVLLPETPQEQVRVVAERLRERVAQVEVVTAIGVVRFTVSIGVAQLQGEDESYDAFLARADQALYSAKTQGRNRVVFSDAGPPA